MVLRVTFGHCLCVELRSRRSLRLRVYRVRSIANERRNEFRTTRLRVHAGLVVFASDPLFVFDFRRVVVVFALLVAFGRRFVAILYRGRLGGYLNRLVCRVRA